MYFLNFKQKRKFDSAIQKNRPPIKDPTMFKVLEFQFQKLWLGIFVAIKEGKKFNQKDAESALKIAYQLVKMEPLRGSPWVYKSWILSTFGRCDESLEANLHAIEIDPSDPDKWGFRASILRVVDRISEANEAEKRAKKLRED